MANWLFTARQRFTPHQNKGWDDYIRFSGFTHITEVVTLDNILCPDLIDSLIEEDWSYNVQADYRLTWFTSLTYLRQRINWCIEKGQLLAMLEQPACTHAVPPTFEFCGFDILDDCDGNSVLTNCGRFSEIFNPSEVNTFGLLSDLNQANTIAAKIRTQFPDESHCRNCRVWQIARDMEPGTLGNKVI
ncbi:MAG: hypothetical protein F6K11_02610 [Leptolyngbya sp. SIO3F4]|nr:hypothetical protein [Leptolyngbya sp. SIO3F4]